ncbi:MAG: hypothetical protein KatS3mg126_1496 [Lysobacteraceae bacterium]|nr:MAG: hypothetical protein KatS3mg126_1496 [Xanthomonadaceae bacterium]
MPRNAACPGRSGAFSRVLRSAYAVLASALFAALPPAQAAQWWAGCTQAGGTAGQCTGSDVHIGEWQGPFHCWHVTNSCSYGITATDCWVRGGRPVTCERCEGDLLPWNFDTALDLLQASAGLRMHACTNELRSDTGWGATIRSLCSLGSPTSTQYQLGIPIIEHRQVYFGGTRTLETGCKEGWSLGVDLSRQREIKVRCPPGYEDLGYGVCVRPVDDTCPVGNPVAPGSGSKLHTEVDFEVDAHPLLRLQRTYNSGGFYVPIGEYPQDANAGQLGFYWRTNFDLRLWRNYVSAIPIQAQRADGRVVSFNAFGEELQKINGRAALRLESLTDANGNPVGWRLFDESDRIETYNAAGRLVRIENKDGQFVDLAYDGDGRLHAVTDERGRSITFDYLHGRLNAAHFPDGQVAWYRFDEKNRLIEVRYGSDGMRAYRYEHPTRQHLLTGIVDERGVLVASYEYDERGRVVRSLNAPGVADGTINRRTYSYASNGDVTMVDPLGTPTTFVMTTQKGVRRVASFSQPCPTCGGSSQQQRVYDARGYLAQVTDFRGVVRSFQRDGLGREVLVTEVANGLPGMPACPALLPNCEEARRSTRTIWSPVWNVPVKRERLDAQGAVVSIWQQALNERGQITARCEYDPAQDAATRYECGTQANAPEGVRQTRWIYCNAADSSAPDPIGDVAEDELDVVPGSRSA